MSEQDEGPRTVGRGTLRWDARPVVKKSAEGPRLYVRLRFRGPRFSGNEPGLFAMVGESISAFVEVAGSGHWLHAYFSGPLPPGGVVALGADGRILLRSAERFNNEAMELLQEDDYTDAGRGI